LNILLDADVYTHPVRLHLVAGYLHLFWHLIILPYAYINVSMHAFGKQFVVIYIQNHLKEEA